jgi:hypothetical protein
LVASCRDFYEGSFDRENAQVLARDGSAILTRKDAVDIWLYTHAVHAGPKLFSGSARKADRTFQEFDSWSRALGRAQFEYQFRSSLQQIGSRYSEFERQLAGQLLSHLQASGMTLGFSAHAALSCNPYPPSNSRIDFDDAFWHLRRESVEQTFERLLARQCFSELGMLIEHVFDDRSAAIDAVVKYDDLSRLIGQELRSRHIVGEEESAKLNPALRLMFQIRSSSFEPYGRIEFISYQDGILQIDQRSLAILSAHYLKFRSRFLDERSIQRGWPRWVSRRWDR